MLHLEHSSCFAANQQIIRNIYWHDVVTIFFSLSNSIFTLWFVVVVEFWDIRKAENEKVIGQMKEIGENSVSNIYHISSILGLGQASDKKLDKIQL